MKLRDKIEEMVSVLVSRNYPTGRWYTPSDVDGFVKLSNKHALEMLEDLLKKGHGGGNWRRLIIMRMEKIKEK